MNFNRSRSGDTNKRSGTRSFFRGLRGTKNSLPAAPAAVTVTEQPQQSPSYGFISQQKGEVDDRAENRGKTVDEEIRKQEGKNEADQEGPKTVFTPPTHKVVKNEKSDQPGTSSSASVSKYFNRFWKLEIDYDLEEVVHSTTNYWIPNCIAMFEILDKSGRFSRDNRFMVKHHPEYLDYAVACYYSIIFFIQILRAQLAAGKLDGFEKSFFNRFKDKFKFEDLPISSIMYPYLSTIVSCLSSDSKYGWIVPTFSNDLFQANVRTPVNQGNNMKHGGNLIQPNVAQMLMILRKAISTFAIDDVANPQNNFDPSDRYIPVILNNNNATSVFGNDIQIGTEAARNSILYHAGIRFPFNANATELARSAPKWRRSAFREFMYSISVPAQIPVADRTSRNQNLVNDKVLTSLEHLLCMEKGQNVEWFNALIDNAALHARFTEGVLTLSDVPDTSGKEPMVVAHMYDIGANEHSLADRTPTLGLDDAANADADHVLFYPPFMTHFRAGFATNREAVSREETLQAMSYATNATFSISEANGVNRLGGNNEHFRTGRFWQNQEWTSEFRYSRGNDAVAANEGDHAKPMFENWSTMFQEDAAVVRPTGY